MGVATAGTPLTEAQAQFIQNGVSVVVASAGADLAPSQARGVGCLVAPDRRHVTVILRRSQATTLLQDLARSGLIAVVFCQPSTHRTLQVKGADPVARAAAAPDLAELARQAAAFHAELAPLGYPETFTRALLGFAAEDLVEVSFAPQAVFSQTPGPRAGERVS